MTKLNKNKNEKNLRTKISFVYYSIYYYSIFFKVLQLTVPLAVEKLVLTTPKELLRYLAIF